MKFLGIVLASVSDLNEWNFHGMLCNTANIFFSFFFVGFSDNFKFKYCVEYGATSSAEFPIF